MIELQILKELDYDMKSGLCGRFYPSYIISQFYLFFAFGHQ